MTDEQILFMALCLSPAITAMLCGFWRALELSAMDDTKRFPRYGQSDQMRTKGKSKIKNAAGSDKEN